MNMAGKQIDGTVELLNNLVDEDLFINSEIYAMRFILRNLISNANKFTIEGGDYGLCTKGRELDYDVCERYRGGNDRRNQIQVV